METNDPTQTDLAASVVEPQSREGPPDFRAATFRVRSRMASTDRETGW